MNSSADAVVIGGGMQGLSCAYYLSLKGRKVILVEQGDLANGTTSRSDGDNFTSDSAPGYMTAFSKAAVDLIRELSTKTLGRDVEWMERGCILLADSEAEMEAARETFKSKTADGIPCRLMDAKEVHDDEPNTATDIPGGIEFLEGGSVNPMLLSYAIGEAIQNMGGQLLRFTKVTGIEKDENGAVVKVKTDKGDIVTKTVVIAAGVWSAKIAKYAGLDIPVTAMKGDILVVEPDVAITRRKTIELGYNMVRNEEAGTGQRKIDPFMQAHGIGFLIEPTNRNNALIGFSKYPCNHTRSSNLVTRAMANRAIRFFPMIQNISIIRTYAGLRPWTPDHEPIVSKTPVTGLYLSTGHCGNGITYAPLSGKLISQLICGEKTDFDMSPLSLERFLNKK